MRLARAAGGILWRETAGGPRLALVHRPKRDDWTLPKGRLEPGEGWVEAARRELAEETGCAVRLGRFAGAKLLVDRPEPKLVVYWHAFLLREGPLASLDEIDEVAWLSRREALERLDHGSDRRLLLRALGGRRHAPWRASADAGDPGRRRFDDLRTRIVVDSRKAERALAAILPRLSGLVSVGAGHPRAARA